MEAAWEVVGDDLLSHAVAHILPSVLAGLTAGFGMGPGVPPPRTSPTACHAASLLPSTRMAAVFSFGQPRVIPPTAGWPIQNQIGLELFPKIL